MEASSEARVLKIVRQSLREVMKNNECHSERPFGPVLEGARNMQNVPNEQPVADSSLRSSKKGIRTLRLPPLETVRSLRVTFSVSTATVIPSEL